MSKKNENKDATEPKGTTITSGALDRPIILIDGEPVWRVLDSIIGAMIYERDEKGHIPDLEAVEHERLTYRKAIVLALGCETESEKGNVEAKLLGGHLQRKFWRDKEIKLSSEDVAFTKARCNGRWGTAVFTMICEFLEGVE